MANMLNSPEFLQQMSSVMSNPQIIDQIIASNPQLQAMGPQVRQIFQSEGFRQMLYVTPLIIIHALIALNAVVLAPILNRFGGCCKCLIRCEA